MIININWLTSNVVKYTFYFGQRVLKSIGVLHVQPYHLTRWLVGEKMWIWELECNLGEKTAFGFLILSVLGGLEGSQHVPRPHGIAVFSPKACTAVCPQQSRELQVVSWLLNNLVYVGQVWAAKSNLPARSPSCLPCPNNSTYHSASFQGLNSRLSLLKYKHGWGITAGHGFVTLRAYQLHGAGGCVVCQAGGRLRRRRLVVKRGHAQAGPGCPSCQQVHRRTHLLYFFLERG